MREKRIRVSEEELEQLKEAKESLFGTTEIPHAVAISRLCELAK